MFAFRGEWFVCLLSHLFILSETLLSSQKLSFSPELSVLLHPVIVQNYFPKCFSECLIEKFGVKCLGISEMCTRPFPEGSE